MNIAQEAAKPPHPVSIFGGPSVANVDLPVNRAFGRLFRLRGRSSNRPRDGVARAELVLEFAGERDYFPGDR